MIIRQIKGKQLLVQPLYSPFRCWWAVKHKLTHPNSCVTIKATQWKIHQRHHRQNNIDVSISNYCCQKKILGIKVKITVTLCFDPAADDNVLIWRALWLVLEKKCGTAHFTSSEQHFKIHDKFPLNVQELYVTGFLYPFKKTINFPN